LRLATFNARLETVTTKPFFREPFIKRRCLMPVSGYYEWEDTPVGKQPHYFTARNPGCKLGAFYSAATQKRARRPDATAGESVPFEEMKTA
jgi:putative SOS response-associated peptidase YedK